ncbi:NAD(P)-binding protein, partial [candidate division WOR-3 bacterium]|nr:NAD(P)-binding protein [candidate division WOR-3 bacterium]
MTEKTNVAIAGGGLSGLTAAFFLQKKNIPYILVEKEMNFGGLCRSERYKDYIFDYTGHLLHFSRKDVRKFVEGLNLKLLKHDRKAFILHSSRMIPYPFQANLAHLEPKEAYQALTSFLKRVKKKKYRTTDELFRSLFGDVICEYFFNPYNHKLWTTDLSMLAPDWTGRFVPKVEEDQVLRPFIFKNEKNGIGYNSEFFYPEGGIGLLPATLSEKLFSACSGEKIVKIFYKDKTIKTEKREISYEKLVYTIPLNVFASLAHPPLRGDMLTAFKKLKHVSVLDIEYALKGKS